MKTVSVVLPVYNEAEVIREVVTGYYNEIISKIPGSELIVVEDGSIDGTKIILSELSKQIPIKLVTFQERKGYTVSVIEAFRLAEKELIFFSDSDGQHEPKDIWKMLQEINNYDIVTGYKFPRVDSYYRLFITRIFRYFIKIVFGIRLRDINCAFKLIKREVVEAIINNMGTTNFFSTEFMIRAYYKDFKIIEIPVTHYKRKSSGSRGLPVNKLPKIISKLIIDLFKLRFELKNDSKYWTWRDIFRNKEAERTLRLGKIAGEYNIPKYVKLFLKCFQNESSLSILELGAGSGEISMSILSREPRFIKRYVCTEILEEGVESIKNRGIESYIMDAENIGFPDNCFDLVCCFDVMHHVSDCKKMAEEMTRVASKYVFLIEANGFCLGRKLLEKTKIYKKLNENSYYPWEYISFFNIDRFSKLTIKPFLFVIPRLPELLFKPMIMFSEILERIPILKWQCSSVMIFGKKNKFIQKI